MVVVVVAIAVGLFIVPLTDLYDSNHPTTSTLPTGMKLSSARA